MRPPYPTIYYYPQPELPPDKDSLSDALTQAVEERDIDAARRAFDQAFWHSIELVPDGYQLLLAVASQDKPIIRLLVTHGASWTAEEISFLRAFNTSVWPGIVTTLRSCGLSIDDQGALPPPDMRGIAGRVISGNEIVLLMPENIFKGLPPYQKKMQNHFKSMTAEELAQPKNFTDFAEAHRRGYYKAPPEQMYGLLLALGGKYKSGKIPAVLRELLCVGLRAIKDSGADFGIPHVPRCYGLDWLGKKRPGLAKILLDLDVLKPDDFHAATLAERMHLGEKQKNTEFYSRVLLERQRPEENAEFYFQVLLELQHPEVFIPLRGKITSYEGRFKKDMLIEAISDIRNRQQDPNPPRRPSPPPGRVLKF